MANYIGSAKEVDHYIGNNLVVAKYIGENKYFDAYSEVEGNLPLGFKARVAHALKNYRIYGTAGGSGTATESGEPAGYKIPISLTDGTNTSNYDLFIGDSKLSEGEYLDFGEQKVYKTINGFNKDTAERYELAKLSGSDSVTYYHGGAMFFVEVVQNADYTLKVESNIVPSLLRLYRSDNPLQHLTNGSIEIPYTEVKDAISGENTVSINSGNSRYIWLQFGANWWKQESSTATILFYTLQPTDPPLVLPAINTYKGENTLSSSETVGNVTIKGRIKEADPLPEMTGIKAVFEYGGLSGTTWKNKVGANNFTWTEGNAPTDNGTEYVLSGNTFDKAGQYDSSDDYSGAVTMYLLAKFEEVKNGYALVVGGLESGYTYGIDIYASNTYGDYATASRDAYDLLDPAVPANEYHVIAVTAASTDSRITVYGDGIKQEHTTPRTRLPRNYNGKAALYGMLPSGRSAGNMHVKFVAFGNERQTDEQIVANSQFIMQKYGITAT